MKYPWKKISSGLHGASYYFRWFDVQARHHEAVGVGIGYDYKRRHLLVLFPFFRVTVGVLPAQGPGRSLRRALQFWSPQAKMYRAQRAYNWNTRDIGRKVKQVAAEARIACFKCHGLGWNKDSPWPKSHHMTQTHKWFRCGHCWGSGYHDRSGMCGEGLKPCPSSNPELEALANRLFKS